MEFEDIYINQLDFEQIQQTGEDDVIIPYLLSAAPPQKWINLFREFIGAGLREARNQSGLPRNIKVYGKKITFECKQKDENVDKAKRGGSYWNLFENSIERANKEYSKSEKERLQKEVEDKKKQDQKRKDFDEFKKKFLQKEVEDKKKQDQKRKDFDEFKKKFQK